MPELKEVVDNFASDFTDFRKKADERLKAIEEKNYAPADLQETVTTMAADLAKASEQIEEVKKAAGRHQQKQAQEAQEGIPELTAYKAALNDHLRGKANKEEVDAAYAAISAKAKEDKGFAKELKTLYVGSDPDGGFGVGYENGGMLEPIITEFSNMRQYARVINGMKPEIKFTVNKKGGSNVVKASELQAYVKGTTPNLGTQIIPAHIHYALPTISEQMLEDADFDVLGWLQSEVAESFASYDDNQFFVGDGAGEAKGILTRPTAAAGSEAYGTVGLFNSGGATSFVEENLIEMSGSLKRPYYSGTVNWFVERQTFFTKIATLKNGDDDFRMVLPDFTNGVSFKLLGFDVAFAPDMPSGGTGGNKALAFGNFNRAYTIYDRTGVTVKRFEEVESPEVWFRYRRRNGGDVTNFEAYKLMQMSV